MPRVNKGLEYEQKLYMRYKAEKLVPPGFTPASSGSGTDLKLFGPRQTIINTEVKYTTGRSKVDYGQAGLLQDESGKWYFSERTQTEQAIELRRLLESSGSLDFINRRWTKRSKILSEGKTQANISWDRINLPRQEQIITNTSIIESYYLSKGDNYIQVANYGLYHLGSDIAGLGVPRFKPSTVICVFRLKEDRFTTALTISGLSSSNKNLDDSNFPNFLRSLDQRPLK